jgi:hypothetical protein
MLLVVLGAGASYDSADLNFIEPGKRQEISEWQPPLANQLFDARTHFYEAIDAFPDCRSLVVALRAVLSDGTRQLEEELDKVSQKASADARAASQLMAVRYYLQQTLQACSQNWSLMTHGCTNYQFLVERLDEWARDRDECVLYVTFNYDTLLEQAVHDSGPKLQIEDLAGYISHARVKIFKLHGSSDWAHDVHLEQPWSTTPERHYVIEHAKEITIPDEIILRSDQKTGTRGQAWVPALAVPIASKGDFVCPSEHIEVLQDLLPSVDRLLIIGWRATERNFLNLLAGENPKAIRSALVVCGTKESGGHTWMELEEAMKIGPRPPVFPALENLGVSNFENALGFSDLVKQPGLIDNLLGTSPKRAFTVRP